MSDAEIARFVQDVEDYLCAVANEPQYHWFRWLAQQQVENA